MGDIFVRNNKAGKPRYTARTRIKGCKPVTKTFGRLTDARDWLTKTEAALLDNRDFPEREAENKTLNDLIDRYKLSGFMNKPGSKDKQSGQLDRWAEHIGHKLLKNLTSEVISDAVEMLKARKNRYGKSISNSTINRYKAALSAALTYAKVSLSWMKSNPAREVPQLKENKPRERYLNKTEFLKIIREMCLLRNKKVLPLFLLSIATGLRKSEALRIEWSHIDFADKTLRVPTSKNGEPRVLPIDGLALNYLRELKENRHPGSKLVFHGKDLNKPMNFETAWKKVIDKTCIENFRWHDNRHTAAVYFRKSGCTIADIADILGHKTLTVSWRYAKYNIEEHRSKVNAMNSTFIPVDLVDQAQNVDPEGEEEAV